MKPCRKEGHGFFFFLKSKKIYEIYLVSFVFLRVRNLPRHLYFFLFSFFFFLNKGSGYLTPAASLGEPSPFLLFILIICIHFIN